MKKAIEELRQQIRETYEELLEDLENEVYAAIKRHAEEEDVLENTRAWKKMEKEYWADGFYLRDAIEMHCLIGEGIVGRAVARKLARKYPHLPSLSVYED
jgi:hypothetical protein